MPLGSVRGKRQGRERGQRLRARHAPPAPHGARRPPGAAPAAATAGRPTRRRPLPRALPLRWAPRRLQPPGVERAARVAAAGGGAAVSIGVVGWGQRPAFARPPSSAPGAADGRTLRGARVWWRWRAAGAGSAAAAAELSAGAARAPAAAAGQRPLGRTAAASGGDDKRPAEMGLGVLLSVGEGQEKVLLLFMDNV